MLREMHGRSGPDVKRGVNAPAVAQALLPVRVLQSTHGQECPCYRDLNAGIALSSQDRCIPSRHMFFPTATFQASKGYYRSVT